MLPPNQWYCQKVINLRSQSDKLMNKIYKKISLVGIAICFFMAVSSSVTAQSLVEGVDSLRSVVFLGNSITHRCQYSQYIEDFYLTRYPEKKMQYHTAGVAGDKVEDALLRFNADVARYKPDVVTILLGMNDASYRRFDINIFETYKKEMLSLLDSIERIGATPVLMSPTMFDSQYGIRTPWLGHDTLMCEEYNGVLAFYGAFLQETAFNKHFPFVNLWYGLNAYTIQMRKTDPEFTLISDGVHPDPLGMAIMACSYLEHMGSYPILPSLEINIWENKIDSIKVKGALLSQLKLKHRELSFQIEPNALPWILPGNLSIQLADYTFYRKLNQQQLVIGGLEPGNYSISINGEHVAMFSHLELSVGVDLQDYSQTPQHRQAQKIAQLNATRNHGLYELRNLYLKKKTLQNYQLQLSDGAINDELKEKVHRLEMELASFQQDEEQILNKAQQILNEIYQVNEPEILYYQIKKMDK